MIRYFHRSPYPFLIFSLVTSDGCVGVWNAVILEHPQRVLGVLEMDLEGNRSVLWWYLQGSRIYSQRVNLFWGHSRSRWGDTRTMFWYTCSRSRAHTCSVLLWCPQRILGVPAVCFGNTRSVFRGYPLRVWRALASGFGGACSRPGGCVLWWAKITQSGRGLRRQSPCLNK